MHHKIIIMGTTCTCYTTKKQQNKISNVHITCVNICFCYSYKILPSGLMGINKRGVRIGLKSYDVRLLDKVVKELSGITSGSSKIAVSGPIPLPNKRRVFTVMKSTHVYKESNEQFELCCHKRLLILYPNSPKDMETLSKVVVPSGVQISIKI
jgi:small subunit ribosomal protein S10